MQDQLRAFGFVQAIDILDGRDDLARRVRLKLGQRQTGSVGFGVRGGYCKCDAQGQGRDVLDLVLRLYLALVTKRAKTGLRKNSGPSENDNLFHMPYTVVSAQKRSHAVTHRILFVCLGNICRSPAAQGVFRALMPEAITDSAGTSDWHVGEPPYGAMRVAALNRGIDLDDLRARQFGAADFAAFDLILGMDANNMAAMQALRPAGNDTPLHLFTDYAPEQGATHVPDPYYTRDFNGTLDLIEHCATGLKTALDTSTAD
ncbi:MAG: protein-tyrosine phosphatase [Paracoccaceae bacterium]|jgi:protein-tyrosine phosphatase